MPDSLAQKAQDAGLPYPNLHILGNRAEGYAVCENGRPIAPIRYRNSVLAQRAASAIRDERWRKALGEAAQ